MADLEREIKMIFRATAEGIPEVVSGIGAAEKAVREALVTHKEALQGVTTLTGAYNTQTETMEFTAEKTVGLTDKKKALTGVIDLAKGRTKGFIDALFGMEQGLSKSAMAALVLVKALKLLWKSFMACVNAAGDFEFQLARVKIVSEDMAHGLKADMQLLGDAVKENMQTSIFQMKDITEIMYQFGAAGKFTSEEIAEATEAITDLAMATGYVENLGSVAERTAAIMNIYGDQVDNVTQIVDVMGKAANDSMLTINDMGTALRYVGPISVMAGQEFEEVSASLQVLSNQGLAASQAGRYLRQVFTYLADRTPESEKALRRLGIETIDAEGNFRDLSEIVHDLTLALEDMPEEEQVKLLTQAFGVWGAQAMSAMVVAEREAMEGADAHARTLKEVRDEIYEEGYAAERAAELLDTYEGKKRQLTNTIKTMAITMGEKALPAMTEIMDTMLRIAEMESFQRFIEFVGYVFEGIAEAIKIAAWALEWFMGLWEGKEGAKPLQEVDYQLLAQTGGLAAVEAGLGGVGAMGGPGGYTSVDLSSNTINVYGAKAGTTMPALTGAQEMNTGG